MNHTGTANGAGLGVSSQAVAAGIGERADPRVVLADRVDQLYGQMWLGIAMTFVRDANPRQWLRWLAIAALAMGATWGGAGAVFFPARTDEQQVFLAFVLAGMMSGGIPVYAASWPIFALYAAGIVVPFTYVLATYGNRLFTEIALLVPMFYAINVAIAYR